MKKNNTVDYLKTVYVVVLRYTCVLAKIWLKICDTNK